jgi:hypothetical protein
MKQTIFISTKPGDADTEKGWRQPRSSFGQGLIPPTDERWRFRAHPWYREISRLIWRRLSVVLLMWLSVAALLALYPIGILTLPSKSGTVSWIISVSAIGLYATLTLALILMALGRTVSVGLKAIERNLVFRQYLRNSTHEEAVACLRRYLTAGQPYALYFRSFNLEAGIIPLPNNTALTYMLPPLGIESKLASALKRDLSLIALDNPA